MRYAHETRAGAHIGAPIPMSTLEPFEVRTLVDGLLVLLDRAFTFNMSGGLYRLWGTIVWMITGTGNLEKVTMDAEFLSEQLGVFMNSYGMVIYSVRGKHINANLCLPRVNTHEYVKTLIDHFVISHSDSDMLQIGYVINLYPLLTHIDIGDLPSRLVTPTRFVDTREQVGRITFDKSTQEVCIDVRRHAIARIISSEEIRGFRPLAAGLDDTDVDGDEQFWVKTRDGMLVLMTNPSQSIPEPLVQMNGFASHISTHSFNTSLRPQLLDVAHVLRDRRVDRKTAYSVISMVNVIPSPIWILLVHILMRNVDLCDEFIFNAADHITRCEDTSRETKVIQLLSTLLGFLKKDTCKDRYHIVRQIIRACRPRSWWQPWISSSHVLSSQIDKMGDEELIRLCTSSDSFLYMASSTIAKRAEWDGSMTMRASQLIKRMKGRTAGRAQSSLNEIQRRLDGLQIRYVEGMDTDVAPSVEGGMMTRKPVSSASTAKDMGEEEEEEEGVCTTEDETYHELALRIAGTFDIDVTLIGSGIFFTGSDVDLVVTVPDCKCLDDAYAQVQAKTEWSLVYQGLFGSHTAILRGVYAGRDIDAQVWRGHIEEMTPAELSTRRALDITQRLTRGVDDVMRQNVRLLHRWASCAGVKSNLRCMLPGIAVTAIAVAFSKRVSASIGSAEQCTRRLLRRLHSHIISWPTIDIDDDDEELEELPLGTYSSAYADGCLRVIVDDTNVTSRMCRQTTRFLFLCIEWALEASDQQLFSVDYYQQCIRRRMVRCAVVNPRSNGVVALRMHRIAASFDGHPVICGLLFMEESTHIVVMAALTNRARDHYTFFGRTISVCLIDDHAVTLVDERTRRQWRLCWIPAMDIDDELKFGSETASTSISKRLVVPTTYKGIRVCIPNAPYITQDVCVRFSSDEWCIL